MIIFAWLSLIFMVSCFIFVKLYELCIYIETVITKIRNNFNKKKEDNMNTNRLNRLNTFTLQELITFCRDLSVYNEELGWSDEDKEMAAYAKKLINAKTQVRCKK